MQKIVKRCLLPLSASFVALLITLAVAELTVRLVAPQWLAYRMLILNVGEENVGEFGNDAKWEVVKEDGSFKQYRPSSKFYVNHYEYQNVAHIDSYGARASGPCRAPGDGVLVPFLGDSFTFGVGVEDHETYVSLLNLKTDYCLLNLGVPGSALEEQLQIVRLRHEELGKPGLYIFNVFLGNDIPFEKKIKHETLDNEGEQDYADPAIDRMLADINDFVYHHPLIKRSYLVQFVRTKLVNIYNAYLTKRRGFIKIDPIFLAMNTDNIEYIREFIKGSMRELESLAQEKEFNYVAILLPDRYQANDELRGHQSRLHNLNEAAMDPYQPNRIYREILESNGRRYLDITPCFIESGKGQKLYYTQDNHFTSTGHRIAADCISPWLTSALESSKP